MSESVHILSWSSKNKLYPYEVLKTSREKYWFQCKLCNHEDEHYIYQLNPKKCFYCEKKKLCGRVGCNSCFKNSVASMLE